jgi:hypothetical protein
MCTGAPQSVELHAPSYATVMDSDNELERTHNARRMDKCFELDLKKYREIHVP